MRILFDTNVLYAALTVQRGFCGKVFEFSLARHSIILSDHVLAELRKHLAQHPQVGIEQAEVAIAAISSAAVDIVIAHAVECAECRDPNDLPVLGSAVTGRADAVVTGDKDLLVIRVYNGIPIFSPRGFFDRFLAAGEPVA